MASADHSGVDDITKFRRFMNFGSDDGLYLPGERSFGKENAQLIRRLIGSGKGEDIVKEISDFSSSKHSVKPSSSIFALAVCARSADTKTKRAAYKALTTVCKTSVELFAFVGYAQILANEGLDTDVSKRPRPTGWGRAKRNAISDWYCSKDPLELARDVTRFKQRGGWNHVDLLRLAHTKASRDGTAAVLKYLVKGIGEVRKLFPIDDAADDVKAVLTYLEAVDTVKHSSDEQQTARLLEQNNLTREHLPTNLTKSAEIWLASLNKLPLSTILSSLGKLASLGILAPGSQATNLILERLKDESMLKESRLHPFNVLIAWKLYEQGHGEKGRLKWLPDPAVQESLNSAFYRSFMNVMATNKKFVMGISITGSLALRGLNGTPAVSAAVAAATMALVTARIETHYKLVVFSSELRPVALSKDMELVDICRAMSSESTKIPIGMSDVCLPITWACDQKMEVDVFLIYTDAQTSSGPITPLQALANYRRKVNPRAKLVFCGMAPNTMLLGASDVQGVLNIVNFDPTAPYVIENFIAADV